MDFLVDVITSGTVRGADAYCTPEEVAEILGTDFVVNRSRRSLTHAYSVAEFSWTRSTPQDPWLGWTFKVVPPEQLLFSSVHAAVSARGFSLQPVPNGWWQPDAAVLIVVDDGRVRGVWAPHQPRPTKEFPSLNKQAVTHLRSATPAERESWLAKRRPTPEDSAEWWRTLLATIRIREQEHHGPAWPWLPLYRWALTHADLPAHERALLLSAAAPAEAVSLCESALPPITTGTTPEAVRSTRIRRALQAALGLPASRR
ncbi:hypothetical protein GCM10022247_50000 [Allokutzneria multivorans]|uniref:Uncharacterized protein n=1 Tax=Allokutzneria multivorans TaxID=1142134 RepID=A0ABP7T3A3_9PSEU